MDLEKRRVIQVSEGRGADAIAELAEVLAVKGSNVQEVSHVAIDMSLACISGVKEHLPKAQIVFDKFHFVAKLSEAMDEVRKSESKGNELL